MSLQLGDALTLGWCSRSGSFTEKDTAYKTDPDALHGAWACVISALPPRESVSGSRWHIWCVHAPLSIWPLLLFCRNILSEFPPLPVYLMNNVQTSEAFDWMIRFTSEAELLLMSKPVLGQLEGKFIIPPKSLKLWPCCPPFTPISQVWQAWKLETSLWLHSRHDMVHIFLENEE